MKLNGAIINAVARIGGKHREDNSGMFNIYIYCLLIYIRGDVFNRLGQIRKFSS